MHYACSPAHAWMLELPNTIDLISAVSCAVCGADCRLLRQGCSARLPKVVAHPLRGSHRAHAKQGSPGKSQGVSCPSPCVEGAGHKALGNRPEELCPGSPLLCMASLYVCIANLQGRHTKTFLFNVCALTVLSLGISMPGERSAALEGALWLVAVTRDLSALLII